MKKAYHIESDQGGGLVGQTFVGTRHELRAHLVSLRHGGAQIRTVAELDGGFESRCFAEKNK